MPNPFTICTQDNHEYDLRAGSPRMLRQIFEEAHITKMCEEAMLKANLKFSDDCRAEGPMDFQAARLASRDKALTHHQRAKMRALLLGRVPTAALINPDGSSSTALS